MKRNIIAHHVTFSQKQASTVYVRYAHFLIVGKKHYVRKTARLARSWAR